MLHHPELSIIIPARNEEATIETAILECQKLQPLEIIVVANGCTDQTAAIARKLGCTVLEYPQSLGPDVGKAVGAQRARGQQLLFVDADFAIPAEQLKTFLQPLMMGEAEVILNDLDPLYVQKKPPHSTTIWRQITNAFIRRDSLHIDSVLSVPHAFTREVLQAIGAPTLANPILAHIRITQLPGIRIHHQHSIDVITPNRYRPHWHQTHPTRLSPSEKQIIGDHLAALAATLTDSRGGFSDGNRQRDLVKQLATGKRTLPFLSDHKLHRPSSLYGGQQLSVIIPACNESYTIRQVIREVRKIEPVEIIVVDNGSHDQTAQIALQEGASVLHFEERLGNDVGRAIGALAARGEILLFIDADMVLGPTDLYPFAKAVASGTDVAFNDLNHYLTLKYPYNIVTACKYGVNLALDRKDLGVASLVAVPHALHRRVIERIGAEALLSPVRAQVSALLKGFAAANVHRVEVDKVNRIRPQEHFSMHGHPPAVERIIGDHVEGIWYLIRVKGERGLFPDTRLTPEQWNRGAHNL